MVSEEENDPNLVYEFLCEAEAFRLTYGNYLVCEVIRCAVHDFQFWSKLTAFTRFHIGTQFQNDPKNHFISRFPHG